MIRVIILKFAIFMLVLVLHPLTEGQLVPMVPITPFAPRPLCNYQMALANQACAYLPFIQVPPPAPRAPFAPPPPMSDDEDSPEPDHERRHRGHDEEDPDHDHDNDHEGDHDNDHEGDDNDRDHDHKNKHKRKKHKRRHHRRHHHRDTPVEQQCCKWLSQVDDQCVCELLVRLPPFLARPVHRYSVIVGRACNITYSCGSRLRT